MRKFMVLVVLIAIALLSLTSCSTLKLNNSTAAANAPTNTISDTSGNATESSSNDTSANATASSNTDASGNEPAGSNPANSTEPSGSSESSGQDIAAATEEPVDDSISLESIKKGAQDAGYTVDDNKDMQQNVEPKPVNGFTINYQDDNSMSQIPVYEFSSSADAQSYAGQVNKEGYCLCITNGKFLGIIGSKYGIVLNDKEKAVLETLFKSQVMAYEEPAPAVTNPSKDFAGACTRIDAIHKALDTLVNKSVLLYTKSLPEGDPSKNIGTISFSMASSSDMAFIADLCEDQAKIDAVIKTWEYFGCTDVKIKHDAANDYIMTGKRAGMDTSFNIHCAYSPDKDSLRILDKDGSQIADFFEFVPLGGDKYAVQTLYERAIVEYKDGKIASLIYSAKTRTQGTEYNTKTDSIYPNGTGADNAWVSKLGEDKYEQFITFDGATIQISAVDFTGDKLKVEMNLK